MTDPVIGSDGHTYERTAITEWLTTHSQSPLTRQLMTQLDLTPNYALRSAIDRWRLTNEPAPRPDSIPILIPPKEFEATATQSETHIALNINLKTQQPMETIAIAVLDVSGSMTSSASNNNTEGLNLSRLDLVKHSMKTVATLLNSQYATTQSSLSIVTFSDTAKLVMPLTKMDQVGLNAANTTISGLRTEGSTNIWDGLRLGLTEAERALIHNPTANVQILLLTDGEPTPDLLPPRGIQETLRRRLEGLKGGRVTISTFGFGYALDANLLESICVSGNGTYGFIPDCSMVGTVFINWATKALLTLAHHISVKVNDLTHQVGDLIVGKPQTLLLPKMAIQNLEIQYDNGQVTTVTPTKQSGDTTEAYYLNELKLEVERIKNHTDWAQAVALAVQHTIGLRDEIAALNSTSQLLKDIKTDIVSPNDSEGQIMKAVHSADWYNKWGRNHCIAYHRALTLQQCVNFKDKVLQHFASTEFKELQDKGIDIFGELPAPKPSSSAINPNPTVPAHMLTNFNMMSAAGATLPQAVGVSLQRSNAGPQFTMANYVSNSGPCFTGNCKVLMADATQKHVEDLKRGDKVWGGHKVAALLYTRVEKEVDMVHFFSGLTITPWHPMKYKRGGEWVFPTNVGITRKTWVSAYYNLVLESGHIVELNGFEVVTLGHDFRDNDVISHPYFGTHAVIDDLKKHPHWVGGFIVLDSANMVRSSENGMIQKI